MVNIKKLLKEIKQIRKFKDPEIDERIILNEFIEDKIEENELPIDFDCSYFECHQLYKELTK